MAVDTEQLFQSKAQGPYWLETFVLEGCEDQAGAIAADLVHATNKSHERQNFASAWRSKRRVKRLGGELLAVTMRDVEGNTELYEREVDAGILERYPPEHEAQRIAGDVYAGHYTTI